MDGWTWSGAAVAVTALGAIGVRRNNHSAFLIPRRPGYSYVQEPMEVAQVFRWEGAVEAPSVLIVALIVAAKQKPRRTKILRGFTAITGGDGVIWRGERDAMTSCLGHPLRVLASPGTPALRAGIMGHARTPESRASPYSQYHHLLERSRLFAYTLTYTHHENQSKDSLNQ